MPLLLAIVILSIAVLAHEFGHFLLAKRAGIKVEEFGIGFPPRILKLAERDGTIYSLNAIPFGGFVRILGEDDPTVKGGFASQPKRVRSLVLLAGPAMNVLLGVVLFTAAFMSGYPAPLYKVKVVEVAPGSPAAKAGLKAGDIILSVDGNSLQKPSELSDYTREHLGEEITLLVKRGEEEFQLTLVPRPKPPPNEGPMGIVIGMATTRKRASLPEALLLSLHSTVIIFLLMLSIPFLALMGKVPLSELRPVGPVGATRLAVDMAQQSVTTGWWFPFLIFMGFLNVALAEANLLPIPGLDGGRLLFVVLEAIRGKRVDYRRESWVHMVGFLILIALMVIVTYFDVTAPLRGQNWGEFF
ncbi:MAG TPA: RIP metalloprotease [Chloroflexi bacterium]|nr:RIP metalloprotease [Chloroflexota bacterium]